jgi:hypothetical protein
MVDEGDLILIYQEDQPVAFARIEYIEPDIKKDWHQVTLLLLSLPVQEVTWILRWSYVQGEPYTMGGKPMRLEKVERVIRPQQKEEDRKGASREKGTGKTGTVIPFKKP